MSSIEIAWMKGGQTMRTPWGNSQYQRQYAPGITFYSTPSHGGYYLPPTKNAQMPEALRITDNYDSRGGGWYEEDCDWCLVVIAFPEFFPADKQGPAMDTFINWHPDRYEKHYGVTLGEGMSFIKDERLFYERHKEDQIVVSASGDWDPTVSKGFVGVTTWTGGRFADRDSQRAVREERAFLVPKDEYDARGKFGFVVDPARHPEWKRAA